MYRMGWSYDQLYMCPAAHLDALIELFRREAEEHGNNRR